MSSIVNEIDVKIILTKDKLFAGIFEKYGIPPNWQRPQGFVTLSRIILEQQVSLESAKAHFYKLNNFLPSFCPEEIVKLSDEEMRNCQISRQKLSYLKALSTSILDGKIDLESISKLSALEVRQQLKQIKGIGDWTVDIYQIFSLQLTDTFPKGDIAIITTIKELNQAKTKSEIDLLTESWKPLRSLAAYFLWHYYLSKRKRNVIY